MRWIYKKAKVKFSDGLYTLVSNATPGNSNHQGRAAPPGFVWKKLEITKITFPDYELYYDWKPVFVWWPVTTISGKRLFFKRAFRRRCLVTWGNVVHQEPITQYATLFDIMTEKF